MSDVPLNGKDVRSRYRITLKLIDSGWVAVFTDPRTIEVFGTDTLPTGFTEHAKPELVVGELRRLNPDADIVLATPHDERRELNG